MHPPHLRNFLLALILTAGMACDENAPTETRAPVRQLETGAAGDGSDLLAQGDVSAAAIALPVNQSVATTAPAPAFRINQTGNGPNGIFQITRAASTQSALQGLTNGKGRAGFFQLTNALNTQPALMAQTNGTGQAGSFQIANSANALPALMAQTNGTGQAGLFQITNPSNGQNALQGSTNGSGGASAVYGVHTGTNGYGGAFDISGNNPGSAVLARSVSGLGNAGRFTSRNNTLTTPSVVIDNHGRGTALLVQTASNDDVVAPALDVGTFTTTGGILAARFVGAVLVRSFEALALQVVQTGSGKAAEFQGDVVVTGNLTKPAGSFRIDHPLDPEHKYLQHSFVESPDMMNVYNGNVTLDQNGRAIVELPDYFEALNRDFRYQLTAIGTPGPNLYISEGVQQNRFRIAGGRAYAHVSWQVTGVRKDTYAEEHRIRVEEEKPPVKKALLAGR